MRSRCLPLVMIWVLFTSPVFAQTADYPGPPSAVLERFLTAVTASGIGEGVRSTAEGTNPKHLPPSPLHRIAATTSSGAQTYFPMQHGDTKAYTSNAYGGVVYQYTQTSQSSQTAWTEHDSMDGSKTIYGYSGSNLVMFGAEATGSNMQFATPLTMLTSSQLANGGTIHSQSSFTLEGYAVNLSYTSTVKSVGTVTVPAGTFSDCIEVSMTFSYTVAGDSDSMDVGSVWVLAPDVGKIKIAIMDQFMNSHGWMELQYGTAGGEDVTKLTSITPTGYMVSDQLWIGAVIRTEDKGPIEGVWQLGGEDTTTRGDRVIWGYFYADPRVMSWGSQNNPDLFVKIWMDVSGPVYVDYFHVSVPDINVYTDFAYDGTPDQKSRASTTNRLVEHYFVNGTSGSQIQSEDGLPPVGYTQSGNPTPTQLINNLRIGAVIQTEDKGPIDGLWRLGGQDTTTRGDQVVWGYFYADPQVMSWGSQDNPDLFVKVWFDVTGAVYVDFFHVSVPDIEVYSGMSGTGGYEQSGTTILSNRFVEHIY